jgi:hypothetical protein
VHDNPGVAGMAEKGVRTWKRWLGESLPYQDLKKSAYTKDECVEKLYPILFAIGESKSHDPAKDA